MASAQYATAFGIDPTASDDMCLRELSLVAGVPLDLACLPKSMGGLGCVPQQCTQQQQLLCAGHSMLHSSGLPGERAARYAGSRAGPFWRSFASALEANNGSIDTNGSIVSFPDPQLPSVNNIASEYVHAHHTHPLRRHVHHLHPSITAYTIAGTHPVARLPDHMGQLAAQLATLSTPPPDFECPLCRSPKSKGQAGHHRRCKELCGVRGDGHHAIVRAIVRFVSDTSGLSASSVKDHTTNTIPDITIHGLDGSPIPYYIELKTSECRGEDYAAWAKKERAAATAKYSGLSAPVHVLTVSHDGQMDGPSWSIIRKLQGTRNNFGLRHLDDRPQVSLVALLGHQLVQAEAAVKMAYDRMVSSKLSH